MILKLPKTSLTDFSELGIQGQLIQKTIVSRQALQQLKIKLTERDAYIHLPYRIDRDLA